jgi:hypothetical protein
MPVVPNVSASEQQIFVAETAQQAAATADSVLAVYWNGVLTLRVRSIGEAARLVVEDGENGRPQFRLMRPARGGAASLMRGNGRGVP